MLLSRTRQGVTRRLNCRASAPFAQHEFKEIAMSTTLDRNDPATESPKAPGIDMKLEVVVIPVSNVDRAKDFYARLGWRLDADFVSGDDYRVIQFTPPGSGCSVIFGRNVTAAA